jgi:hypothetical protein
MRHLVTAALMILGSLLTVQTTIGTLELLASRSHADVDEVAPPAPLPGDRDGQAALRLPTGVSGSSQGSLHLPARGHSQFAQHGA